MDGDDAALVALIVNELDEDAENSLLVRTFEHGSPHWRCRAVRSGVAERCEMGDPFPTKQSRGER